MMNVEPKSTQFPPNVASIAELVQADFTELFRIFEEQLRSAPGGDETLRAAILDSKKAAERGLTLSNALLEMLRASPQE